MRGALVKEDAGTQGFRHPRRYSVEGRAPTDFLIGALWMLGDVILVLFCIIAGIVWGSAPFGLALSVTLAVGAIAYWCRRESMRAVVVDTRRSALTQLAISSGHLAAFTAGVAVLTMLFVHFDFLVYIK